MNKCEMKNVVSNLKKVIALNSTIPELRQVQITSEGGKCKFEVGTLDRHIEWTVPGNHAEDFRLGMDLPVLEKLVDYKKFQDIHIRKETEGKVVVTDGETSVSAKCADFYDVNLLNFTKPMTRTLHLTSAVISTLRAAEVYTEKKAGRQQLESVALYKDKIAATNGKMLYIKEINMPGVGDVPLLIPSLPNLSYGDIVALGASEDGAELTFVGPGRGYDWVMRMKQPVAGRQYPDIARVIPVDAKFWFKDAGKQIMDFCELIKVCSSPVELEYVLQLARREDGCLVGVMAEKLTNSNGRTAMGDTLYSTKLTTVADEALTHITFNLGYITYLLKSGFTEVSGMAGNNYGPTLFRKTKDEYVVCMPILQEHNRAEADGLLK